MATKTLHLKIQQAKAKALPINSRSIAIDATGKLVNTAADNLEKRIIEGYAVIWGRKNDFGEIFIKGSFSKSLKERGAGTGANYEIKFLYNHKMDDVLSLFAEIKEDDTGLYFKTVPLDPVPSADRTIVQIRSKSLNNFSIGFDYVWEQMEYDEAQEAIIMKEAKLFEISVVGIPADQGTFAYRGKEDMIELHDDTEDFIMGLPRKFQMEARTILARHKSLLNANEPNQRSRSSLDKRKKPSNGKGAIDYKFLTKNL